MNEHITSNDLIDYLHGELNAEHDALVLAHLNGCQTCRAAHDDEARLSEALHVHAAESERDLPYGLAARIREHVQEQTQRPQAWATRLAAFLRPMVALPVAAAVVVGAFVGVAAFEHGAPRRSIDAAVYLSDHAALTRTVPFAEGGSVVPATLASDNLDSGQSALTQTGSTSEANDSP